MAKDSKTFYKYRAFNTTTLDALCLDTVYFSSPKSFNDPLDCAPTLECDSPIEDLRKLLSLLVEKRVKSEILANLKNARVKSQSATEYAQKQAFLQAKQKLHKIAYYATDYEMEVEKAESQSLVNAIEGEINKYYERGVCSFSTSYKNPLLWSHYGDQHKGLCISYGIKREPAPKLEKVIYGGNRSIQTSTLAKAFLNKDKKTQSEIDRDMSVSYTHLTLPTKA